MAMTGDSVVAYPGTFTGSIGVVFLKPNLHGLYDKLGISIDTLKRGKFADVDSLDRPLSPEGRAKLREGIEGNYRSFVEKVAQARKKPFDQIESLAQGRVWLGSQAKDRGLVDELGGIDRAIDLLKEKAKIGKDEKVTIVTYPPRRSIFDLAFGRTPEASFESRLPAIGKILGTLRNRMLLQGGLLRIMPYSIEIR